MGGAGRPGLGRLPKGRKMPVPFTSRKNMGTASTIRGFDVSPSVMRKEDPTWRFALGAKPIAEGHVLALIAEDGTVGYGYASVTAHMGAILGSGGAELEHFKPYAVGANARAVERILSELDRA